MELILKKGSRIANGSRNLCKALYDCVLSCALPPYRFDDKQCTKSVRSAFMNALTPIVSISSAYSHFVYFDFFCGALSFHPSSSGYGSGMPLCRADTSKSNRLQQSVEAIVVNLLPRAESAASQRSENHESIIAANRVWIYNMKASRTY